MSSRAPDRPWRIGVLEDDAQLREGIILPGLRYFGFQVVGAGHAAELYRSMLLQSFDMVVLDIGVPDEDGLSVLKHLREVSSQLGIVMLTANTASSDHLEALKRGADAFLNKPVNVEILAATLHGVGRRLAGPAPSPVSAVLVGTGKWRMDTDDWCLVTPDGLALPLTAPERCILRLLVAMQGAPVSREKLIASLTSDVYDFDPHRLEMMVHRLRRKAQDAAGVPLPLLTSRGQGYRFVIET
ncbi:response regulator transcription factor [Luteibacter aegosomatissinici]|uniref:response regulator transcription factor n=1 Tax=Luteibacter aegosomatissinici TaxID=2911539 RepID=UPI001FF94621|nr:response regulator transcription factor [Luteibacter aegosomatissinici]UPG96119.1 response regulator transcription factor [Luteibacter aegosomatissinici]